MRGAGSAVGVVLLAAAAAGASRELPLGDAERGQQLFRTLNCIACHSVDGQGAKGAPDLGQGGGRNYSPAELAGLLWNLGPLMWAQFEKQGLARPALSSQQAADLFAYFYAARYFEQPGSARRGQQLFRSKQCGRCHGIAKAVRTGVQPVAAWRSLEDPIALAQQMWNHAQEMKAALAVERIPYPGLGSQELTDVLAYLRSLPEAPRLRPQFSPASAQTGRTLFEAKGCARCHQGGLALESRPTRYSLTDFAAALWNHPAKTTHKLGPLSYQEMRRLVGYLSAAQFFEERGEPGRGQAVFVKKRCPSCHERPSSRASSLAARRGNMTSFAMVEALWKHGPAMLARMRQQGLAWPRFSGSEMADLTAYLHGPELRRR